MQTVPLSPRDRSSLVPFVKLAHPSTYVACGWDLRADVDGRLYWCEFFRKHIHTIAKLGIEVALARGVAETDVRMRSAALLAEFDLFFAAVAGQPERFGPVTILSLDEWRDWLLRKHGFIDPFIDLKNRENEKMLPLLPTVCHQLDAIADPRGQVLTAVRNIFAGNIFDMGAAATAAAFVRGSPDFFATRSTLPNRPWLIDQYDAFAERLLLSPAKGGYRKCVFFIDNAGSDFLLGAVPFIRWMAQRGTNIVVAANERPTLNDMTIHDVIAWWPRVLAAEPSLATLPIQFVTSGTGEPLIDLAAVSPELNIAASDADLVILEGMGRGVESNLDAAFTCDAANLAMLKDEAVAKRNGGKVFDVICRFRRGRAITSG